MRSALVLLFASAAFAQPAFEVTSVKLSEPGQPGMGMHNDAGRLILNNTTLRFAIRFAFDIQDFQFAGAPKWVDSDHFEIEGKCAEAATYQQKLAMLQTLLADRFQMKFHRETREVPGYALIPAKGGLKLTKAKNPDGPTGSSTGPTLVAGTNQTMAGLASMLSSNLGRLVIDETGHKDRFDFRLNWASTPDEPPPSVFTLIQELGLRLEARRVPVEMFVIDSVEKPAAN
jgi:uncharacterized protein (TIGR03435 family)